MRRRLARVAMRAYRLLSSAIQCLHMGMDPAELFRLSAVPLALETVR